MRLSFLVLAAALLLGCATQHTLPVASVSSPAPAPASTSIEIRHMYLFAPGKAPVKIVLRDDGTATRDEAWSNTALDH